MNKPLPYIAHLDLDSFFVSAELLQNPALKGLPVIIGGSATRGVVTTCSYEARKYGVKSAMPMIKAMELCPHAVLVKSTRGLYSKYSAWVTQIISSKAPLYQKASIDEFYVDLTGMDKYFNPYEWTLALKKEITETTGLPISFGLASNKLVAKIATDEAKPNGALQIPHGMEQFFLAPLKVGKIPGVGNHLVEKLQTLGIVTIGDLLLYNENELENLLGKNGNYLYKAARGEYISEVNNSRESKSISNEHTFDEYQTNSDFLLTELVRMTEKVAFELRREEKSAACVTVKIRYHNFETFSKQLHIEPTIDDSIFIKTVKKLFNELYKSGKKVRLLGVKLSQFQLPQIQGNLFTDVKKNQQLFHAIDAVKLKYGKNALQKAITVKKD